MWHCDIANVRKIDYGTLTPSLLSLNLVRKLWCCDAHKLQGPIPHSPNRAPSAPKGEHECENFVGGGGEITKFIKSYEEGSLQLNNIYRGINRILPF